MKLLIKSNKANKIFEHLAKVCKHNDIGNIRLEDRGFYIIAVCELTAPYSSYLETLGYRRNKKDENYYITL